MKNSQTNSKDSSISEKNSEETKKINCLNKSPVYLLCANVQCSNYSFLCADQKCQCYSQHLNCFKASKDSLVSALMSKLVYYNKVEKSIKQQIQKSIDYLSELQQALLSQCKLKFKELIGLNDLQKNFLASITNGNVNHIKGNIVWSMVLNHKKEKKTIQIAKKLQQDVKKIWNQFQKDLYKLKSDMKSTLQIFGKEPEVYFSDSKVIANKDEIKIMQGFFESQGQKIKSIKLLFRASQNSFSANNFHKSCNSHNQTITICENTYGKKFGGYSSLAWNSNQKYYTDSTYKSFLFSVTNNYKFIPDSSSSDHIQCSSNCGPTFGNNDLYIADGCDSNFSSSWNLNKKFKSSNCGNNYESNKLFIGSQQNNQFKVKEYQVWKVEFA